MSKANIFRTLYPDEIDVRVQQVTESGGKIKAMLLLYKNARVDMDLLDEHFGCLGWQREHTFKNGRNYCKVSIYEATTKQWISKEDVGIESNSDEVKGEASDSFKRACVTFGIGRELYSAPVINIELNSSEVYQNGISKSGKPSYKVVSWVRFKVSYIEYDDRRTISNLTITDQSGRVRYSMKPAGTMATPTFQRKKITIDNLMDSEYLRGVCDFLKKRSQGKTLIDTITRYYECDDETATFLTNEYLRIYA